MWQRGHARKTPPIPATVEKIRVMRVQGMASSRITSPLETPNASLSAIASTLPHFIEGLPRVLLTTESTFYYLSVQHECRFRDKDWVSYGHRGSFSAVQELATLRFHQESSSSWNSRHSKIRDEKIRDMKFQGFRVSHSIGGVLASNAPSPLTPPDCS